MGRVWVICKKIFSVSLVFNALLTISCLGGILAGFYTYYAGWKPFSPYLISGNLLWVPIIASIINIYPSASLGRSLHTGRFLFHHYFYGLMVLIFSALYVTFLTPVTLLNIFLVNNTTVQINIGRFFLLGGLTLLLDDLPDANEKLEVALNWLKGKVGGAPRFFSAVQFVVGAVSSYVFVAVALSVFTTSEFVTVANLLVVGSLLITAVTSFIFVKRQVWVKIAP